MAILEFEFKGIDQNFRSSAANVLKDIDKIKSAFGGIGSGSVDVSGLKKGMDEVTASIKKAESDNKMFLANEMNQAKINVLQVSSAIKNDLSSSLNQVKVSFVESKKATQDMVTEGKSLDNQYKQTKVSIAELALEQKKLTAEQRASRANLQDSPYSRLSRELNEMRNEAKNLGAEMLILSMKGDTTSKEYLKLEQAFNKVQSKIAPLDSGLKQVDSSLGQNQRRVGAYGNALKGLESSQVNANGVAMEFNRIIQDAPFGMMGIGNNIQQLSSNWQVYTQQAKAAAAANGTTVTSMGLMKGAMTSMMSTGNLITLGIAVITSAWTFYTMQQQKANKATKDNRSEMDKLKDSMSNYNQVLAENEAKGQNEITRLNRLMSVYKDVNQSQKTRKGAYEDMISLYETYFGKLSKEERKTFDLAKAYDKLSVSILKTAKARAFDDLIQQNEKDIILLEKSLIDSGNKIIGATNKVGEQYRKNRVKSSEDASKQGVNPRNIYEIKQAEDALNKSAEEGNKIATKKNTLLRENKGYEKEILALGLEGAKITDSTGDAGKEREKSTANTTKNIKESYDYLSQIRDLVSGKQKDIDLINVDGQAKDLIELEYKWEGYFNKIADLNNKLQKDIKNKSISSTEAEKVKEGLRIASGMGDDLVLSEQAEILKKFLDKREEIIKKYNERAGIIEQDSREKELRKEKEHYEKELQELITNGATMEQAIEKLALGKVTIDAEVNLKWDNKDLEEWGKLNDEIQETIDKPFSGQNPKSIQSELEKRIGILKKLLEQLARATGQPFNQDDFDKMSKEMKDNAKKQKDDKKLEKDIQDYTNILKSGVDNVFTNLKTNIDEFGLKARSVFYSLGETVSDMLSQMSNKSVSNFMDSLTTISENGKTQWQNMDSSQKKNSAIGAGLGMAGSAVLSMSSPSDSVGQGLGGALTGASAGMAFGPWGAAAGAVVGGISGLLKAAKSKRQEKILLQQYEEQKKANVLLERMSALTYASQIIGQKTEYGIVSGVRRNEFGQIVSVVQGQDIIMVADRANNKKQR